MRLGFVHALPPEHRSRFKEDVLSEARSPTFSIFAHLVRTTGTGASVRSGEVVVLVAARYSRVICEDMVSPRLEVTEDDQARTRGRRIRLKFHRRVAVIVV